MRPRTNISERLALATRVGGHNQQHVAVIKFSGRIADETFAADIGGIPADELSVCDTGGVEFWKAMLEITKDIAQAATVGFCRGNARALSRDAKKFNMYGH